MFIGVQGRLVRPQPVDYGVVRGLCAALCGRYACLRPVVIGHSVLGREISALVLSVAQPSEPVLLAAAFRGQEWLSALYALRLCEDMCRHLRAGLPLCGVSLARALEGRQVWFVPLVNPDGVEVARYGSVAAGAYAASAAQTGADVPGLWQANACGVDICYNFSAGWEEMQALAQKRGKNSPGPRDFGGDRPESEPETGAVTRLCRGVPFRHGVVLRGEGETISWHHGEGTPPQSRMMAQVLGAVSGYAVALPAESAAGGGFEGWFTRTFRRPALTVGSGSVGVPPSLRDFETVYAKAQEMLLLSVLL